MKKVRTMEEAYRVFEYLGVKEVTKKWQKAKGTEVWELPLKTMLKIGCGMMKLMSTNGLVNTVKCTIMSEL
jgi:hypothetical protein